MNNGLYKVWQPGSVSRNYRQQPAFNESHLVRGPKSLSAGDFKRRLADIDQQYRLQTSGAHQQGGYRPAGQYRNNLPRDTAMLQAPDRSQMAPAPNGGPGVTVGPASPQQGMSGPAPVVERSAPATANQMNIYDAEHERAPMDANRLYLLAQMARSNQWQPYMMQGYQPGQV